MSTAPQLAAPLAPLRPRWVEVDAPDPSAVESLAAELRLPPLICRLLLQRGHGTAERAKSFLRPSRDQVHSGQSLGDIVVAADRIAHAIARREPILVHGDYDVDGICSTALLVRALAMMGGRAIPFVPHRTENGYDLGPAGVSAARAAGARLIVTADCGISAHGAIRQAGELGIDVVVTDHHTPPAELPPALAVVNPNRQDCPYPDKGLAGAAVAFKVACEVARVRGFPEERLHALIDLVALATIADLAPLTAENRALVRWGMSILERTPNPGLRALLRTCGLAGRETLTAGQIGFVLAPRLNAAGRLGDAMRGVRLLLTDDRAEALALAEEMEAENRRRQKLDAETLTDALRMLERDFDPARTKGVVLASDRWHPGVIGIVASRVVERIHRPTVLIALGDGEGKGSARSIRGFHLYNAFAACAGHLIRFGGHRAAAGCSLLPSNVEAFRIAFNDFAESALPPHSLDPEITIDARVGVGEASVELHRLLRHLGPFGIGNPTPVFEARGVRPIAPRVVGKKHLKLVLRDADGSSLPAIGFGMGERALELRGARTIDVAFKLEENRPGNRPGWIHEPPIQARIVDFRTSA